LQLNKQPVKMKAKRIVISIALRSCLLLCSCRSSEEAVSHARWQSTPVVADGMATEWEIPLRYYSKGGKVGCAVSNDNTNLYVCIRSSDQETRMKMIRSGMTVAIDTSGKKANLFSINYPIAKERALHSREEMKAMRSSETQVSSFPSRKQRILQDQTTMNISGFINTQNGENPLKTLSGITVCMNLDSFDVFTYEAVIPLKTFYKAALAAKDTSKVLNIYITVNGIAVSGGNGMSGGGSGHGGGGGGGGARMGRAGGGGHMGGGGGYPHGSSAGTGDMTTLTEPNKLQIQFRLNFR
jgi:hypothetical protein